MRIIIAVVGLLSFNSVAIPTERVSHLELNPSSTCNLLSSQGYKGKFTRWVKANFPAGDLTFTCFSDYKELRMSQSAFLANNIAFYADGTESSVRQLKLIVNVNDVAEATNAYQEFYRAAEVVINHAIHEKLSDDLMLRLSAGQSFETVVSDIKISLVRDEWPSGNGHELILVLQ